MHCGTDDLAGAPASCSLVIDMWTLGPQASTLIEVLTLSLVRAQPSLWFIFGLSLEYSSRCSPKACTNGAVEEAQRAAAEAAEARLREYAAHGWNINNLPRHQGSVLRYLEGDELITGVQARAVARKESGDRRRLSLRQGALYHSRIWIVARSCSSV